MIIIFDAIRVNYTPSTEALLSLQKAHNGIVKQLNGEPYTIETNLQAKSPSMVDNKPQAVTAYKNMLEGEYYNVIQTDVIPTANENLRTSFNNYITKYDHLEPNQVQLLLNQFHAQSTNQPLHNLDFFEKYYQNGKVTYKEKDGTKKEVDYQDYHNNTSRADVEKSFLGGYQLSSDPAIANKQKKELIKLANNINKELIRYHEELLPYAMTLTLLKDKDYDEAFKEFTLNTSRLVDESKPNEDDYLVNIPANYIGIPTARDYNRKIETENSLFKKTALYGEQIPARSKKALKNAGNAIADAGKTSMHFIDEKTEPAQTAVKNSYTTVAHQTQKAYNTVGDYTWRPIKNKFSSKEDHSKEDVQNI